MKPVYQDRLPLHNCHGISGWFSFVEIHRRLVSSSACYVHVSQTKQIPAGHPQIPSYKSNTNLYRFQYRKTLKTFRDDCEGEAPLPILFSFACMLFFFFNVGSCCCCCCCSCFRRSCATMHRRDQFNLNKCHLQGL